MAVKVLLTQVDAKKHSTDRWPRFLPDGKHVLYLAANHRLDFLCYM